jgi:DNA-binding CsgD family transcriptional regulator
VHTRSDTFLTPYPQQVINLVARDATAGQIAQRLRLAPRTITMDVHATCQKCNLPNRTAAVQDVMRSGIPEQSLSHLPCPNVSRSKNSESSHASPTDKRTRKSQHSVACRCQRGDNTMRMIRRPFNGPNRGATGVTY